MRASSAPGGAETPRPPLGISLPLWDRIHGTWTFQNPPRGNDPPLWHRVHGAWISQSPRWGNDPPKFGMFHPWNLCLFQRFLPLQGLGTGATATEGIPPPPATVSALFPPKIPMSSVVPGTKNSWENGSRERKLFFFMESIPWFLRKRKHFDQLRLSFQQGFFVRNLSLLINPRGWVRLLWILGRLSRMDLVQPSLLKV